jgi:hypothetical protein
VFMEENTTSDKGLLKEFQRDIKKVFGINSQGCHKSEGRCSKWVFDSLRKLGVESSYKWFVGKEIFNFTRKRIKSIDARDKQS